MKRNEGGVTLIELMVVITIISILLMIAIPAYFFYDTRSKVTEGIALANPALQSANQYFRTVGTWPGNNLAAGIPQPVSFASKFVRDITVSAAGGANPQITVTYNASNLRGFSSNPTIIFEPNVIEGATRWNCTAGDMPNIYRPLRCRP